MLRKRFLKKRRKVTESLIAKDYEYKEYPPGSREYSYSFWPHRGADFSPRFRRALGLFDLGNFFPDLWDKTCMDLKVQAKVKISKARTGKINGCRFACCPLPAAAMGVQSKLQELFPFEYHKGCNDGRLCCGARNQKLQVSQTFMLMTLGPHGETGSVIIEHAFTGLMDITQILVASGKYMETTAKTTCALAIRVDINGQADLTVGDCE